MVTTNKLFRIAGRAAFFSSFILAMAAFTWQQLPVQEAQSAQNPSPLFAGIDSNATAATVPEQSETEEKTSPQNVWSVYGEGLQQLRDGNPEAAVSSFKDALTIDPQHVKSLVNLTRAYLQMQRFEDAETAINRAVAIDSTDAAIFRVQGRVLQSTGSNEEAITAYRKSIDLKPENNPYAYNNLGLIYVLSDQHEDAVPLLEKAVQQKDDVDFFYNNLGMAYEGAGDFQRAKIAFERALEINPDYDKAAENLLRIKHLLGEDMSRETQDKNDSKTVAVISENDDAPSLPESITAQKEIAATTVKNTPVTKTQPVRRFSNTNRRRSSHRENNTVLTPATVGIAFLCMSLILATLIFLRNRRFH